MAVRRLHIEQPDDFAFTSANREWAEKEITKYPAGRQASAVIPLLWRAQEQEGWVTEPAIRVVADLLDMSYIRVLEVATFYTMFHLAPVGRKAHVQVCGTTPCMLRGAEDLVAVCKRRIAEHPHEVSADGDFSWEEVECLGACVNAPMVQVWSDTYEDLTPDTFEAVLDALARDETPQPGPQVARLASAPEGESTSLTETPPKAKKPAETAGEADATEHPSPRTPKARGQRAARPEPFDKAEAEAARTPGKQQAATKPAKRKAKAAKPTDGKKGR